VPAQPTGVRPPRQRRSRESYERALQAARQLLEENGFEGFTVQEVAARSGVSVGAIYERFGSKESLLRVVHAAVMDSLARDNAAIEAAAVNGSDPAAAIAQAVAGVARVATDHRAILRAFMHLGAVDDEIASRGSQSSIELGHVFKALVLPHRKAIRHPDPELAVDVAYRMVYCTVARQIMYGPSFESDAPISWERLVEELADACIAYLLGAPARGRTDAGRPS
jgi:AcrR family transcriptional regulator